MAQLRISTAPDPDVKKRVQMGRHGPNFTYWYPEPGVAHVLDHYDSKMVAESRDKVTAFVAKESPELLQHIWIMDAQQRRSVLWLVQQPRHTMPDLSEV